MLYLWIKNNTQSLYRNGYSHKALEYVFNKSLLILKLRCTWLPVGYCKSKGLYAGKDEDVFIHTTADRDFDDYSQHIAAKLKIIQKQRQEIEQCSIQRQLDGGDPLPSHFKRSKGSGKRFKSEV